MLKMTTRNGKTFIACDWCGAPARKVMAIAWNGNSEPRETPYLRASDMRAIYIRDAACGRHDRSFSSTNRTIVLAASSLDPLDPQGNLIKARNAYEDRLARERESVERTEREYAESQRRLSAMKESDFTITVNSPYSYPFWIISSTPSWSDSPVPIVEVKVTEEGGWYFVHESAYAGSVGPGRGTAAFTRILARILTEAADTVDHLNAKKEETR